MNAEKLRIGVVGCGHFARNFIPLFQKHPAVAYVCVTDLMPERSQSYHERFGVDVAESFEAMLADPELNCVAIFTQRHTHGPLVIAALEAGKHVYSAVPMADTLEECERIVRLVREKHLIYMMGETCYYYPCAIFCRKAYREGKFGKFVYGASQYYHDIAEFSSYQQTEGWRWRRVAGMPPMQYPTHSHGMILSALDTHATKVACFGYRDTEGDNIFGEGKNDWNNPFSNMISLVHLANGGVARVSECRRIGWHKPSSYISAVYGTGGGYEYSNAQHLLVQAPGKERAVLTDVSDLVNPAEMTAHKSDPDFKEQVANAAWSWSSTAPVQDVSRLPAAYEGLENGHMATHKLLVDDFCRAASQDRLPPVHAWEAARYTLPGIIAQQSANAGGILMDVPDLGDAPPDWPLIF